MTELTLAIAALVCGVCAGCSERQLIFHPGLDEEDGDSPATDSAGESSGGSAGPAIGNFPEPAVTVCGALPEGVDPIPGLATAWAVVGDLPGSLDGTASDTRVRLRFADFEAACDEPFGEPQGGGGCTSHWAFAMSVPVEGLAPQIYDLTTLAGLFPEIHAEDCGGGEIEGGIGEPGAEVSGELEIFSVTDDCLMGELRGLTDDFGDPDINRNGGFVAMRCDAGP